MAVDMVFGAGGSTGRAEEAGVVSGDSPASASRRPSEQRGRWVCPACDEPNRLERLVCNGCSAPSPLKLVEAKLEEAHVYAGGAGESPLRAAGDAAEVVGIDTIATSPHHVVGDDEAAAMAAAAAAIAASHPPTASNNATLDDAAIAAALQAEEIARAEDEDAAELGELRAPPSAAWPPDAEGPSSRKSRKFILRVGTAVACLIAFCAGASIGAYFVFESGASKSASPPAGTKDFEVDPSRRSELQNISRVALDRTNDYRSTRGISLLAWHEGLAMIAEEHALAVSLGTADFSHAGFDQRVRQFPLSVSRAGENLAMCRYRDDVAECAVEGWIASPDHEENLADEAFEVCGIGTALAADGKYYLTQLFAELQPDT